MCCLLRNDQWVGPVLVDICFVMCNAYLSAWALKIVQCFVTCRRRGQVSVASFQTTHLLKACIFSLLCPSSRNTMIVQIKWSNCIKSTKLSARNCLRKSRTRKRKSWVHESWAGLTFSLNFVTTRLNLTNSARAKLLGWKQDHGSCLWTEFWNWIQSTF